jgi:hypothetical protein
MANWTFDSNDYTAREFALIPEGDHRVRITKVAEKVFSTGNEGFEITLEVNGHNSKLWYYLILDPTDRQRTNQRLGMFFDSFAITDYNLSNYDSWVGKDGAVRVRHGAYKGTITAQVAFCLGRKQQDRLPRWQNDNNYVPDGRFDFCNSAQPVARVERQPLVLDGFKF